MPILTLRNVVLGLSHPPLLDGVSFQLERGERACLLGRNGAGKSTLLKIIAGTLTADDGEVARAPDLRIAELAQEVPQGVSGSVYHVVAAGLGKLGARVERYHSLAHHLADGHTAVLRELERCQHELEAAGGWALSQRVDSVLSRLGLNPQADISLLSGGVKRRVMLARALVSEPDLLLLDEPTNHLDIDAITWMENLLLEWSGTVLFITHDRAFLQRVATRILELDRGRISEYPGTYSTYLARKQAAVAAEETHQGLFDKKLAQEEAWIRQGVKARRTRNEGRVRALERMREERAQRRARAGKAHIAVQEAERSGKLVAEAEHLGFDYDGKTIVRDLTTTIVRGDKVGVIGLNGTGKTTLLRLLLGELSPTRGKLRLGTRLSVAYFDQYRAILEEEKTVLENLDLGRDTVTIDGHERHVLSYLQDFLFTPARARQPVKALSGGERNRLLLARLFLRPANVLVLDEPTNDLDAETLELLEERLIDYTGTVLLVSHDRAFLNNVVTSTLAFEGDGVVNEYIGGYDDWLRQRHVPVAAKQSDKKSARPQSAPPPRDKRKKLSYKDQRELEKLPGHIEALEARRDAIHRAMSGTDFYRREKSEIAAAQDELAGLDAALAQAYARWEELEEPGG